MAQLDQRDEGRGATGRRLGLVASGGGIVGAAVVAFLVRARLSERPPPAPESVPRPAV